MRAKGIRTSAVGSDVSCDVCGRTLLCGEQAHPYLDRGAHRTVCELCRSRAEHEGWLREGAAPTYDASGGQRDRRGSLLARLRRRREAAAAAAEPLDPEPRASVYAPPARAPELTESVTERRRLVPEARAAALAPHAERPRPRLREIRHVRAIPTRAENRIAFAIDAFNASEHPRTVAGVARALGVPQVSVQPLPDRPSVVRLVVGWELCWYRYEFDLADDDARVRLVAQGQELHELPSIEREPNAVCDDRGLLSAAVTE